MRKRILLVLCVSFTIAVFPQQSSRNISFSEAMFYPSKENCEFVEIYNLNTEMSINLSNFTIKYQTSKPDTVLPVSGGMFLPPLSYAVIFEGDYDFKSGLYNSIIPKEALVLKINKNAFGSLGMSNTSDRTLRLINSDGDTVDTYTYSANNKAGRSDEKITLSKDNSLINWTNSITMNGTPGAKNSVALSNRFYISSFYFTPLNPAWDEEINIFVTVKNISPASAESLTVNLYNDMNFDSSGTTSEIIYSRDYNLATPDSINIQTSLQKLSAGTYQMIAEVISTGDSSAIKSIIKLSVSAPPGKPNDILINEIMYAPLTNEPEWIELYNPNQQTINLKNWKLNDKSGSVTIIQKDFSVKADEYLILAKDSTIKKYYGIQSLIICLNLPSLNNSGDMLALHDVANVTIDSLYYLPSWGGSNGHSLERISAGSASCDSSNWATSLSPYKATPGNENSVRNLTGYERGTVIINEIMFYPSDDNTEFIELYNKSGQTINIGGWLAGKVTGERFILANENQSLNPGDFFIIAADSLLFNNYPYMRTAGNVMIINRTGLGLNNAEDNIILRDALGNIIDSVYYSDKWHNKGFSVTKNKSLERVNPVSGSNDNSNWSTSVADEGATPGKTNSIYVINQKVDKNFSILPNPFSPDNDGFEDVAIISYNSPREITGIRLKIFDSQGRLVRTIINQSGSSRGSIIFNGCNDNGTPLRIGIYILLLEELDTNSTVTETLKSVVVIARKL
ncbi:MAG: lamin tail domain-containing protein [Ignavibacteria bacterium]